MVCAEIKSFTIKDFKDKITKFKKQKLQNSLIKKTNKSTFDLVNMCEQKADAYGKLHD